LLNLSLKMYFEILAMAIVVLINEDIPNYPKV
jgi:hypothetical protein